MRIVPHDDEYPLDDDWWAEAGMNGIAPRARSFCADSPSAGDRFIIEVAVEQVERLRRTLRHGVFNDGAESGPARQHVVHILRGFQLRHR